MTIDPEGTTCPSCGRTSYHPTDKAKGWCAACERFYPEGEGPTNETEFRRFERRRSLLIEQQLRDGGLDASEMAELERLNRHADAWLAQFERDHQTIDALIAEAQQFANESLTQPEEEER